MEKTQVIKTETEKQEKTNYKLEVEHLYLVSEIADKINFQLPEFPDYKSESIKLKAEGKTNLEVDAILKNMQFKYGKDLMLILFKSMHKAKKEINALILSVTNKDPESMSFEELKETITDILSTEGVIDFFR